MRMGKANKKWRSHPKKPLFEKSGASSQSSSSSLLPGQISSNLIASIYTPKLSHISTLQSEEYANALLQYEEALKQHQDENNDETFTLKKPSSKSFLFGSKAAADEFVTTVLHSTSKHFSSQSSGDTPKWKVYANAAKFERNLNEKYGRFRPFLSSHPELFQYVRSIQRSYHRGEYSPIRTTEPPLDMRASIMLLFMMHRNGVKWEATALAALFLLVGLQPWALVVLVSIGYCGLERRRKKRARGWLLDEDEDVKVVNPYYQHCSTEVEKNEILKEKVGTKIAPNDFKTVENEGEETYDTIFVGSGPATLYSAALLSRTGRTVLVLSPDLDAAVTQSIESDEKFADVPFDVGINNVSHTTKQQRLLAPALSTNADAQGGVRFARIGTDADGYTTDILSIPGMGAADSNNGDSSSSPVPFLIRGGGIAALAEDAATFLGDGWPKVEKSSDDASATIGNSLTAAFLGACQAINASASAFYQTKLLSETADSSFNSSGAANASYKESSIRYASAFFDKMLQLNPHVRSLMAGMGMRGENLPPKKTSMAAHVTHICALASNEGFTYPIGGPRALCRALANVIEQNGGKIVTGVTVKEFLFHSEDSDDENKKNEGDTKGEKNADTTDGNKPRCHGVKLTDDRVISVGKTHEDGAIISMLGFINTFIFQMPDDVRMKHGVPAGLPALYERRPLLQFMFGLKGNSADLSLTGADWYRLPNASLARDEMDASTGEIRLGDIGAESLLSDDVENEENGENNTETSVMNQSGGGGRDKRSKDGIVSGTTKKTRKAKFITGSSWMKVSFPSAKDPSWIERHGDVSTCVVTIEADDDFVRLFDSTPKIYSNIKFGQGEVKRLKERVEKDLFDNFPQLKDKIECTKFHGPVRVGLSHIPQRYAAKGIRPNTGYPGLYVGGSDLTVGDSFSGAIVGGWLVANAVVGYSFVDYLFLEKNITNDIIQFLPVCKNWKKGDIAVPFTNAVSNSDPIDTNEKESKSTQGDQDGEMTAESSKEE